MVFLMSKGLPGVVWQALALHFAQNAEIGFYKFDRVFCKSGKNMTNVICNS